MTDPAEVLTKEQQKLVRDFQQVRAGAIAGMEQGDIAALGAAVLRLELLLRGFIGGIVSNKAPGLAYALREQIDVR